MKNVYRGRTHAYARGPLSEERDFDDVAPRGGGGGGFRMGRRKGRTGRKVGRRGLKGRR